MGVVGVIEFVVGVAILAGWTRLGAYVASASLLGVAANLVAAGFYDVAVRDVVMARPHSRWHGWPRSVRKRRSSDPTMSSNSQSGA